mmetsp:Transcript_154888/g.496305  ORF Transcript_154888/g.496305 Transcript_154888/m.496305 type:complete len:449 (+) Transcript_154888:130-1476(+)
MPLTPASSHVPHHSIKEGVEELAPQMFMDDVSRRRALLVAMATAVTMALCTGAFVSLKMHEDILVLTSLMSVSEASVGTVRGRGHTSWTPLAASALVVCSLVAALSLIGAPKMSSLYRFVASSGPVVLPCLTFMIVGPLLMLLNKDIMQGAGFPYPLTLSSIGLGSSALITHLGVRLGLVSISESSLEIVRGRKWFLVALPIGVAKAITLAAGNAAYLYLGLGFIQMLKAFTPALVVAVLKLFGLSSPSKMALLCIALLISGALLEVKGELNPSLLGMAFMFTSECCEALNLVMTQKLLQNLKFTVSEGLYVLAPPGFISLTLLAAAFEWPSMVENLAYRVVLDNPLKFAGAGILGFVVNFVGFLVVQATSSLTSKMLNSVRGMALVVVGVVFYGEVVSSQEAVGYSISMLGFAGYNWLQISPEHSEQLERRCCSCSGAAESRSDVSV